MKTLIERHIDWYTGLEIILFINLSDKFCVQMIDIDAGEHLPVRIYNNRDDAEKYFNKLKEA